MDLSAIEAGRCPACRFGSPEVLHRGRYVCTPCAMEALYGGSRANVRPPRRPLSEASREVSVLGVIGERLP